MKMQEATGSNQKAQVSGREWNARRSAWARPASSADDHTSPNVHQSDSLMSPPEQSQSHISNPGRPEDTVLDVFYDVWTEFYNWEPTVCRDTLSAMGRFSQSPSLTNDSLYHSRVSDTDAVEDSLGDFLLDHDAGQDDLLMWDYTSNQCTSSVAKNLRSEVLDVEVPSRYQAHHPYEATAPCLRNIFVGDDPDCMPFLPFADEPAFNTTEHQFQYGSFSWQEGADDPDLQLIVIETARRLFADHNISFERIDATGVLPIALTTVSGKRGLIYTSSLRDYPEWPASPLKPLLLPSCPAPGTSDLYSRLASSTRYFCSNLNCMQPYCPTHIENYAMPHGNAPRLCSTDLKALVVEACGADCFVQHDSSTFTDTWDGNECRDLDTLLQLTPDSLPCDLAVIMRKPCQEVFFQRLRLLPDCNIPSGSSRSLAIYKDLSSNSEMKFQEQMIRSTPNNPCHHAGPCTEYFELSDKQVSEHCLCALNNTGCERNCGCPPECQRRWLGCQCSRSGKLCRDNKCPCVRVGRECDPELCLRCEARDAELNVCQNAKLQQGKRKRAIVKKSQCGWGLGTFIAESAKVNDLIAEYLGEILYEPTVQSRDDISQHRRRNYVFELDNTFSLDSSYVGNEMRFINHSTKKANCRASVRLVNGEHRVGIYALKALSPGTELRFNYGPHFFLDEHQQDGLIRSNSPCV